MLEEEENDDDDDDDGSTSDLYNAVISLTGPPDLSAISCRQTSIPSSGLCLWCVTRHVPQHRWGSEIPRISAKHLNEIAFCSRLRHSRLPAWSWSRDKLGKPQTRDLTPT